MAILKALQICEEQGWSEAFIFSDSLSNLLAISSNFKLSRASFLILEIRNLLVEFKRKNWNINLVWIPSHRGIKGNEFADRVAKAACDDPRGDCNEIPHRELKRLWKNETFKESIEWGYGERIFRGSRFFSVFYDQDNFNYKRAWFDGMIMKRRAFTTINRLRCGHSSLRDSLFRFLIVDSPDCPYCGEPETPEHVFWSCFRYNEQRAILVKALSKLFGYGPFLLEFLLQIPSLEVAFILEEFICSLPIFI
ncbi:uncharacterized protein [Temnothorax nylanderi]|uniref:uncharacterized protein n=1 Tax=Temnothorax nylanderi TaxID=102681 RepID=UPI003A84A480